MEAGQQFGYRHTHTHGSTTSSALGGAVGSSNSIRARVTVAGGFVRLPAVLLHRLTRLPVQGFRQRCAFWGNISAKLLHRCRLLVRCAVTRVRVQAVPPAAHLRRPAVSMFREAVLCGAARASALQGGEQGAPRGEQQIVVVVLLRGGARLAWPAVRTITRLQALAKYKNVCGVCDHAQAVMR